MGNFTTSLLAYILVADNLWLPSLLASNRLARQQWFPNSHDTRSPFRLLESTVFLILLSFSTVQVPSLSPLGQSFNMVRPVDSGSTLPRSAFSKIRHSPPWYIRPQNRLRTLSNNCGHSHLHLYALRRILFKTYYYKLYFLMYVKQIDKAENVSGYESLGLRKDIKIWETIIIYHMHGTETRKITNTSICKDRPMLPRCLVYLSYTHCIPQ